jgi:hypothetical protein
VKDWVKATLENDESVWLNLSHVVWMQHYPANNYTIVRILENTPITVRETPEELLGRRADATTRWSED